MHLIELHLPKKYKVIVLGEFFPSSKCNIDSGGNPSVTL